MLKNKDKSKKTTPIAKPVKGIAKPVKGTGKSWQMQDPEFAEQQAKYGQAAPSRRFIASTLEQAGPQSVAQLVKRWQLQGDDESRALFKRLEAMCREGQLILNRRGVYGLPAKMNLIRGRVIGHGEGHGFLQPEGGGEPYFLSPREMKGLLHGDIIMARHHGTDYRGRHEAAFVELISRKTTRFVGSLVQENGMYFVLPENRRIHHQILIAKEELYGAQNKQIVVVELTVPPTRQRLPMGKVVEILGDSMTPGLEVQIAMMNHDLPHVWPDAVTEYCNALPSAVLDAEKQDRFDIRHLPLVTIDGITARDFDDAVYCEKRGNNYWLLVAIADVSHYVNVTTALDEEAVNRGTSVYFPDRVIPMLPEALSNGLCSLNPEQDRLCMVCEMTINATGKVIRSKFHEGVMYSHARLTYDTVWGILSGEESLREAYVQLVPHLENLYALYHVLHQARKQRGAIDFETRETVIEYGADHRIEQIVPSERNDAHKLIEECMITANVTAASFLEKHKLATLYRVHHGPTEERLNKLRRFLSELGLGIGGGEQPTPADYAKSLEAAQAREDLNLIQTVMLRSLSQAIYTPKNEGHFGLALAKYAHFTSPIRRYPDLLVHRGIRHILRGGTARDFIYDMPKMQHLGEQCSMMERRADDAVREATEWLKCEYMQSHIGQEYQGTITGVTNFGLFVELNDVYVDGLVHISSLKNDYYQFDAAGHRLTGERTGIVYRLGDKVAIRVARVSLEDRKIDFDLLGQKGSVKSTHTKVRAKAIAKNKGSTAISEKKVSAKSKKRKTK